MNALRAALRELPGPSDADVLESDDEYLLVVDVPGATSDSTTLTTGVGRLTVEAERPGPDAEYEVVFGDRPETLEFELPLPPDADGANAEASVDRGVLEVRLPRRERGTDIPIEDD